MNCKCVIAVDEFYLTTLMNKYVSKNNDYPTDHFGVVLIQICSSSICVNHKLYFVYVLLN